MKFCTFFLREGIEIFHCLEFVELPQKKRQIHVKTNEKMMNDENFLNDVKKIAR